MIQAIQRAMHVLEVLVDLAPQAALRDIAAASGLPTPTTYRILQTLVEPGYVADLDNGQYKPGAKILALAGGMLASMDYSLEARPALLRLHEVTPETIHFGVLTGDMAQYVDKIESRRPYRLASVVGMGLSLHCTAIGKAVLAFLPLDELTVLLAPERLVRHTPKTITEPDALRQELEHIRARGFSIDDEEDRDGVRCIGAPVFDHQGQVFGAISVSAPTLYFSIQEALDLAPKVMEAAYGTSLSLGAPLGTLPEVLRPASLDAS